MRKLATTPLGSSLVVPVATVSLAAALFAGCSTTQVLDNTRLQQEIVDGLQNQAGVTVTATCPDNRPLQQGDTFRCTAAAADGTNLVISVTQTDDVGNVNWHVIGAQ